MAYYREDIGDIELESGSVFRSFNNKMIASGDVSGNRYGVRLLKGGEPVSMTGAACVGYFIRADGITLVINGAVSGGVAYVELPAAAYAVGGNFTLAVKVSGTGFAETMRIVDGTVVLTTTGAISDPSSEVPSLADLMAVISRAETAAAAIDNISVASTQISGTRYKIAVTIAS